jgi:hypothetical protein
LSLRPSFVILPPVLPSVSFLLSILHHPFPFHLSVHLPFLHCPSPILVFLSSS